MSDAPQPEDHPFGEGFDPAQLFRMLSSEGPVNWEVAREVARWTATGQAPGAPTPAPTEPAGTGAAPDDRGLAELVQAAQTLVVSETGLAATFAAEMRVVDPAQWARLHLDSLRPVLEALAASLSREGFGLGDLGDLDEAELSELQLPGPFGAAFDATALPQLVQALAPALLGVQAGTMVGHLARHAFGQYDLPLPITGRPRLLFVLENLDTFEADWSLVHDDFRFAVALHEVVHAAVRSVDWVRSHLVELATTYVSGYRMDAEAIAGVVDMDALDPTDPSALTAAIGDPEALLGALQTDEQRVALDRLQSFASVLEGYADVVLAHVARPLIPSFAMIDEATRRHRVERGDAERFIERLLGVGLRREHYERGEAFCAGVVERAGLPGLNRLWEDPAHVPTPAELEAPGLWLARIELPGEPNGG